MWNNEKEKKSWPLEYFRKKNQQAKKKNVEQKSEVTEHFVDIFFFERLFLVSMLLGPLFMFIGKHL